MISRPRSPVRVPALVTFALFSFVFFSATGWAQSTGADPGQVQGKTAGFADRFEVRDEYRQMQSGGSLNFIVPRFDFVMTEDLGLRVELPVATSNPDAPGSERESGFGDLLARGSFRVARGAGWSVVAGAELTLDTASKDSLGEGKIIIAPLVFASMDLPRYASVFFPTLQYFSSLGGNDARPDVNYTSLKPILLTRWRDGVYTIVEPNIIIDHERSDRVGLTLEAEAGRFLNRNLAVWARPGFGLYGDNLPTVYNWNFQFGVRYFLN
jgi:hypothetical protein